MAVCYNEIVPNGTVLKGSEHMRPQTDKSERKALLRASSLFGTMSEESERFLLALESREFSAGDVIAGDGGPFELGFLLSGKASIFGKNGAGKVLLNLAAKGDVFNAATVFFADNESVSTVVAKTRCEVLFISRERLEKLIGSDLAIASAYIALLSEKIYFLNRKIVAFTAKRADAALAGFLLDRLADGETMTVNMSRLASVLDIGRTTLYRAVDMLTEEVAIAYDGKEMKILSRELLEKRFNQ